MTASDHAPQRPQRFPLPERGRPQVEHKVLQALSQLREQPESTLTICWDSILGTHKCSVSKSTWYTNTLTNRRIEKPRLLKVNIFTNSVFCTWRDLASWSWINPIFFWMCNEVCRSVSKARQIVTNVNDDNRC